MRYPPPLCRGTIYLCAFDTEQKVADRQRETPRQKAMSSWGYKFEQFMMAGQFAPRLATFALCAIFHRV